MKTKISSLVFSRACLETCFGFCQIKALRNVSFLMFFQWVVLKCKWRSTFDGMACLSFFNNLGHFALMDTHGWKSGKLAKRPLQAICLANLIFFTNWYRVTTEFSRSLRHQNYTFWYKKNIDGYLKTPKVIRLSAMHTNFSHPPVHSGPICFSSKKNLKLPSHYS